MNTSSDPREFLSLPHDRMAWSAVGLFALFLLVLVLNLVTGSELAFLMFLAMLAMVGGLVLSVNAIVRHGERSLVLLLPLMAGALVVLFFAVELLIGHE